MFQKAGQGARGVQRWTPARRVRRPPGSGAKLSSGSVHTNAANIAGPLQAKGQAPVAQGIEHRPPEAGARVRIPPGAPHTTTNVRRMHREQGGADMAETPVLCTGATATAPKRWSTRMSRRFSAAFTREQLQSPKFLLYFWFAARLLLLAYWAFLSPGVQGDVVYYYEKIQVLFTDGPGAALKEYPTPVIWILLIPWVLGGGNQHGYVIVFVLLMLALDTIFSWSLWHTGGAMRGQAVVFWTLFLTFVGPVAYLRFDIITSVLAGWSLIFLLRRHNAVAGGFTALGASVKLWPALLWPALLPGNARQKLRATAGLVVTGVGLVALSVAYAGWDRLFSPLTWQQDRGLQIESVWATLPMLARTVNPHAYAVTPSRYQAYEIWGPGVNSFLAAADIFFMVGLGAAMVAYLVWLWRGHGHLMEAACLVLLVITVMIVTNKTFSPQYMIWLGGPMAASFAVLGARSHRVKEFYTDRARLNSLAAWTLLATFLTWLVYPVSYSTLFNEGTTRDNLFRIAGTLILAARNVVVVVVLIGVVRWAWSFLRPSAVKTVRARHSLPGDEQ